MTLLSHGERKLQRTRSEERALKTAELFGFTASPRMVPADDSPRRFDSSRCRCAQALKGRQP